MAIAKYVANNKKRVTIAIVSLIAVVLLFYSIIHSMRTDAGVYLKDDKGGRYHSNEVNVLEIVAENGQQVLGYTVEGQEPISVEQINSYKGKVNIDVEDFKNATGYIVSKTSNSDGTYSYRVENSVLNHTFNDNVLASSMGPGEIKVDVVEARNVTSMDIEKANLIFINSNDYNDNIMYYYDVFVYNGKLGYELGHKGKNYNDFELKEELISDIALKKICSAAGNKTIAYQLEKEDFVKAGVTFDASKETENAVLTVYRQLIAETEVDGFETEILAGDTEDVIRVKKIDAINSVLNGGYKDYQDEALEYILENAIGKALSPDSEVYKNVSEYLLVAWEDTVSENMSYYMDGLSSASLDDFAVWYRWNIQDIIDGKEADNSVDPVIPATGNVKANQDAMLTLQSIYQDVLANGTMVEDEFTYEISDETKSDFEKAFVMMVGLEYKDEYVDDYLEAFVDNYNAFVVDNPDTTEVEGVFNSYEQIQNLVAEVDEKKKNEAIDIIAKSTDDEESKNTFVEDAAMYLERSEIPYEAANVDYYINGIKDIDGVEDITGINDLYLDAANKDMFKEKDTESDEMVASVSKIVEYIQKIDNVAPVVDRVEVKEYYDLSWDAAKLIYEYAMVNNHGLMYNTQLLTGDNKVGNYNAETDEEKVNNNNNLYKMLLVSRQLKSTYYMNNIADKVDGYGVYYPNGLDENAQGTGDGVANWDKKTFGVDYNNVREKYHEPDVVGQTYLDDGIGTKGQSVNYVYKRVYSFTGSQFLGGEKFVATELSGDGAAEGVVNAGAMYEYYVGEGENHSSTPDLGIKKYVYLDTSKSTDWKHNNKGYKIRAQFWGGTSAETKKVVMSKVNNTLYKAEIPEDEPTGMLFYYGKSDTDYKWQTNNIKIESIDAIEGTEFKHSKNDRGTITTNPNARLESGFGLTNAEVDKNITYYGVHRVQIVGSNISNVKYQITGTTATDGFIDANVGDVISFGSGCEYYGNIHLVVQYHKNNGNKNETKTYHFSQGEASELTVSNFIDGGTVEYNKKMSLTVQYNDNCTDVQYSLDGKPYTNIASGSVITLGDEFTETQEVPLQIVFTNIKGEQVRAVTYLRKKATAEAKLDANYLSTNTASSLTNESLIDYDEIGVNENKGDVIRYIIDAAIVNYNFPIRVLEIGPAVGSQELDGKDRSGMDLKELAEMLQIENYDNAKYEEFFDVTYVSVKEFNTKIDDLTGNYDLIYMGVQPGYLYCEKYTHSNQTIYRTQYHDTSMNGLVYTGIGDQYKLQKKLMGAAAVDYVAVGDADKKLNSHKVIKIGGVKFDFYQDKEERIWRKYFFKGFSDTKYDNGEWGLDDSKRYVLTDKASSSRMIGNDLTVKSMNRLLEYLKSGYPILLADEIMYSDDYADYKDYISPDTLTDDRFNQVKNWRYVDRYSKMHEFVKQAKELGYENGVYTGLSNGKKVFSDNKNYASIVSVRNAKSGKNPENLGNGEKTEGGLLYAMNRVNRVGYKMIEAPTQYGKNTDGTKRVKNGGFDTGVTIAKSSDEYKNYKFKLEVTSNVTQAWLEDNYAYQIYIDKSGVGSYRPDDTITIDPDVAYETGDDGKLYAKVTGQWPVGIEGFIPWKLEAYSKSNTGLKYSYEGFSAFEQSRKKDVYVLWIRTENSSNGGFNLDFAGEMAKKRVNNSKDFQAYIDDYNIRLISMSYSEFIDMWAGVSEDVQYADSTQANYEASKLNVKTVLEYLIGINTYKTNLKDHFYNTNLPENLTKSNLSKEEYEYLNKPLDMLVFGFSDSYLRQDIDNIAALKDIENYVNEGHSFLFSHDNASYISTLNLFKDTSGNIIQDVTGYVWARYTTSYLRRMLGMDYYGITNSPSELEEYEANARKYLRPGLKQTDFRGFIDPVIAYHSDDYDHNSPYRSKLDGDSTNHVRYTGWVHTNTLRKVNEGQLTEYPFVLDEYITNAGLTHTQYLALNMEDPDTTVWYTLGKQNSGDNDFYKYMGGDGANNYYIYSKGNITYTGAGHNKSIASSEYEMKLFINTIVAALKVGNFEPVIDFPYAREVITDTGELYYEMDYYLGAPDSKGLDITFRPIDYDDLEGEEGSFTKCKIYMDINGNNKYDSGDILINDSSVEQGYNNQSNYMSDVSSLNKLELNPINMKNRKDVTFLIGTEENRNSSGGVAGKDDAEKYSDMDLLKEAVADKLGKDVKDVEDNFIENYYFIVEITDTGSKGKSGSEATAMSRLKIVEQEYKEADLFNLN